MNDVTAAAPTLLVLSKGAQGIPTLPALLPDYRLLPGSAAAVKQADALLAWGRRPSAERARRLADEAGLPALTVEDGFVRSVGTGDTDPPLSLVTDDLGIYFDAGTPSRLESLILRSLSEAQGERARRLQALWRAEKVSKYNAARIVMPELPDNCVLVADQTYGDASLQGAGAEDFEAMLQVALARHPDHTVLLKMHPEVLSGRKRGHFDPDKVRRLPRVRLLTDDIHPAELLPRVQAVYVMTSQLGFDALLWGVPVHTFGMPFYAGWGLTFDAQPAPPRRGRASLEQLVHAALVDYARYVDPETGHPCGPERVITWLGLQRRMRSRFPPALQALGFSRWKHDFVREFLSGSSVSLVEQPSQLDSAVPVAAWGRKVDEALEQRGLGDTPVLRIEDGFLRSVGLGAGKTRPLSWVVDDLGIYYDATGPSRLERILLNEAFDAAVLTRAANLRAAICRLGVTKYNLAGTDWSRSERASRVLLVTGQVEADASIRFGANRIRSNLELLRTVRSLNPDAWILYKPHPEVAKGLRASGQGEDEACNWCDEVLLDASFHQLLEQVDEVHVLTSQSGFEALLRGVPVTTYGQPFYAGWGLTRDMDLHPTAQARRTRQLTLDELVAGCLIHYPTYVSRTTRRFTTPERILDELLLWQSQPEHEGKKQWKGIARRLRQLILKPMLWVGSRQVRSGQP